LIELLAEIVSVPKSSIEIVRGEKGRNKQVKIKGLDDAIFKNRLEELITNEIIPYCTL